MALESARVQALFSGSRGPADARGEDDTCASLSALCSVLLGWLTWCGGLPFAAPAALPADATTLPYRVAVRDGDPAGTAVASAPEVPAAGR